MTYTFYELLWLFFAYSFAGWILETVAAAVKKRTRGKIWYNLCQGGVRMTYTFYELLWLFFAYSFAGWILETVAAAVKKRTFVNRGLVNGPYDVYIL